MRFAIFIPPVNVKLKQLAVLTFHPCFRRKSLQAHVLSYNCNSLLHYCNYNSCFKLLLRKLILQNNIAIVILVLNHFLENLETRTNIILRVVDKCKIEA